MDSLLQNISREKTYLKIKLLLVIQLLHTLSWFMNLYSNQFYQIAMTTNIILLFLLLLERTQPRLAQPSKALFIGAAPAALVFFMPKSSLFALCAQFISLNFGFNELKLKHMPHLIISNAFLLTLCYFYYNGHESRNNPEFSLIKKFLEDSSQVYQVLLGIAMIYVVQFLQFAESYMDMKTQKQYESKLLQLNTDLELSNAKLHISNKELQEALQEKENFILRFSHEIRNPLNSLLGNIELCYEQTVDKELELMLNDAKVSGEILLQLLNNVLDTAKVAVGTLEVSINPQNIRSFLERSWTICSEIIRKKRLYGCLSVDMKVPEILEFDNHRMMQILINMISNAAKFTDHGYIKLFVEFVAGAEIKSEEMLPKHLLSEDGELLYDEMDDSEDFNEKPLNLFENLTLQTKCFQSNRKSYPKNENRITGIEIPYTFMDFPSKSTKQGLSSKTGEISSRIHQYRVPASDEPKEGYIRFEIIDTGCGISKQYLENSFKKFKQDDSNSSKRQIGTGLGLWITKEIIEMMDGKVEIFSKPNRGTVIVIMVKSKSKPFTPSVVLNEAPHNKSLLSKRHTEVSDTATVNRVLIVEDIEYNQEINKKFLEKCNVKDITIAKNGQEAVNLLLKHGPKHFELILMDIDMPIMDGKTACKIIRQEERKRGWAPVNVVFLTGFSESKTQKELLDARGEYKANGFYSKPASLDTFKRILKGCGFSKKGQELERGINSKLSDRVSSSSRIQEIPLNSSDLVLVVDDDLFNLSMVTKMLKLCQIGAIEARNGQEAIKMYQENWKRVNCILMDCKMPVLDGLEATRLILAKHSQRAAIYGKRMDIYGLTGHVGKEYRQKCLDAGMKDVLEKPIKIEELKKLLKDR